MGLYMLRIVEIDMKLIQQQMIMLTVEVNYYG
jgi:hypothetical protein